MKKISLLTAAGLFAVLYLFEFAQAQPADLDSANSSSNLVKILSVTPNTADLLYVGDAVEMEVEIEYEFAEPPATIALNIQKGEVTNNPFDAIVASKNEVVNDAKGTILMKQSFQVPKTRSINISASMIREGMLNESEADIRFYKVSGKENGQIQSNSQYADNNSVKIISLLPDTSAPLYVGDTVEIEVGLEYELVKSPATITLNIQKGETGSSVSDSIIASKTEVVNEAKGTINIKQLIVVPETGSIQIFTPLMSEGDHSTTTVDLRSYQVLKRS